MAALSTGGLSGTIGIGGVELVLRGLLVVAVVVVMVVVVVAMVAVVLVGSSTQPL